MTKGKGKDGKSGKDAKAGELLVCSNNRALRDYEIEERLEAGMVLVGSEVKSLRARAADLEGAYAAISHNELVLHGMHIGPYAQANQFGHEARRVRKLLAHKEEIKRMIGKLGAPGYTLVPLKVYFKGGRAKVELGLGKGRKREDRREQLKKEIDLREAKAAMSRTGKR
jgi:SsrA-binding protein